jgi:glycosyltransferase involved in cell wall biosynthesis
MVAPAAPRTILYAHSSAGRYGADRQLALLVGNLDPERYRAVVVLPEEGPLAADLQGLGAEVHVRPGLAVLRRALFNPAGLARLAGRVAADARELRRLARARGARLVHSNTSVTLGGAAAATAARLPHVWHVREIYADFARWWPAYRTALLRADVVACLSEATRAQFGAAANAVVVHEGLPTEAVSRRPRPRAEARRALDLPGDAFACLVLGRLNSWKGQEVLARALAEPDLRERAAVGLLAGDAWPGEEHHERALRGLRADLGLGERLRLLGFRDDLDVLYGAADVVCVPSTKPEPLGLAALEAAAAGECVVASRTGGLPEIVRDGETGRLVEPGSAPALARALTELADDEPRRARLGAAAADDVRNRFSTARLVERMQAIYDELLG